MTIMRSIVYEDREIEGERLELTAKDGHYYLGPNLTLRRCAVVMRVSARWLHVRPSRFIDCSIQVKQELINFCWARAFLKGCRFSGRLSGCDFGYWPDYTPDCADGGIEDCDFSAARLDACRFHGCDMSTIRLPPWPCFTILDPRGRGPEMSRVQWPGLFEVIIEGLHKDPPSTVALTYHAPSVAKRFDTTAEELKPLLEQFDFIVH